MDKRRCSLTCQYENDVVNRLHVVDAKPKRYDLATRILLKIVLAIFHIH